MKLFCNESLPTHGAGPYYAVLIAGRIRLSVGGYGWRRKLWQFHFRRWRGTATHFGIGPFTITILERRGI